MRILGNIVHVVLVALLTFVGKLWGMWENFKLKAKYYPEKVPVDEYVKLMFKDPPANSEMFKTMQLIAAMREVGEFLGIEYGKTYTYGLLINLHGNHFNPITDTQLIEDALNLVHRSPNQRRAVVESMWNYDRVNPGTLNSIINEKLGITLHEWVKQDPYAQSLEKKE